MNDRHYVISLSTSRKYLFTVLNSKVEPSEIKLEDPDDIVERTVVINVIDIQRGRLIAGITAQNCKNMLGITKKKIQKLMNEITYVHYDEQHHEVITGHEDGGFIVWF